MWLLACCQPFQPEHDAGRSSSAAIAHQIYVSQPCAAASLTKQHCRGTSRALMGLAAAAIASTCVQPATQHHAVMGPPPPAGKACCSAGRCRPGSCSCARSTAARARPTHGSSRAAAGSAARCAPRCCPPWAAAGSCSAPPMSPTRHTTASHHDPPRKLRPADPVQEHCGVLPRRSPSRTYKPGAHVHGGH